MMEERLEKALILIQESQAEDPNIEFVGGQNIASELLYSKRLLGRLEQLYPEADDALMLAACAQHLRRWEIKRSDYPEGKVGYYQWRNYLLQYQFQKLADILKKVGYNEDFIESVREIQNKMNISKIENAQKLENVVCVVFIEFYLETFVDGKDEEQVINIIRKTWSKMSEKGHQAALGIELNGKVKELVSKALQA